MRSTPQRDEVRRLVLAWIDAQQHAHGARLPSERKLSELLQVRRSMLNEVLVDLEREGLIRAVSPRVREIPPTKREAPWSMTVLVACLPIHQMLEDEGIYLSFGQRVMKGILTTLAQHGFTPLLFRPDEAGCRETAALIRHRPAACIVPPFEVNEQSLSVMAAIVQAGIPVMSGDETQLEDSDFPAGIDCFHSDQFTGEQLRVTWLVEHGHRRLQRVCSRSKPHVPLLKWTRRRNQGFEAACRMHRLTLLPELIIPSLHWEPTWATFGQWADLFTGFLFQQLKGGKAPDAYLMTSDGEVGYAAVACRRFGYDPAIKPCIVGFDGYWWDHPMCRYHEREGGYSPPISIEIDFDSLGRALAMRAIERSRGAPLVIESTPIAARVNGPMAGQ